MILVSPSTQQTLLPHSSCVVLASWQVSVSFERRSGALNIRYVLPASGLCLPLLPKVDASARADWLWKNTCAELFVAVAGTKAYREFNFSAGGDWAAYDFVDYRTPAPDLAQVVAPKISCGFVEDGCYIDVQIDAKDLPDSDSAQFGASVVLESEYGNLSYWAAFHPCAKPDFHHRDGFVLTLI